MSTLTELKLSNAKWPTNLSPLVVHRNTLATKLWDQIQLVQSQAALLG